jgi:hypothetical protein
VCVCVCGRERELIFYQPFQNLAVGNVRRVRGVEVNHGTLLSGSRCQSGMHLCAFVVAFMCICAFVCVCVCMCVYACMYVRACVYQYICINCCPCGAVHLRNSNVVRQMPTSFRMHALLLEIPGVVIVQC